MIQRRQFLSTLGSFTLASNLAIYPLSAQSPRRQKSLKRQALVIGVQDYDPVSAGLSKLATPINDAKAVARKLESLNFETILLIDPGTETLWRAIEKFSANISETDIAIVYYAGHGLQATLDGAVTEQFFAPTDFAAPSAAAPGPELAEAFGRAVAERRIIGLSQIEAPIRAARKVGLVFWDACRNNPYYIAPVALSGPAASLSRSATKASMRSFPRTAPSISSSEPSNNSPTIRIDTPEGVIIHSATQPGNLADDGAGTHSPYAAALLKHIGKPGVGIYETLRAIATEVKLTTDGKQLPRIDGDLVGGDVILAPAIIAKPTNIEKIATKPEPRPTQQARKTASPSGRQNGTVDCVGQGCSSTAKFSDGKSVTITTNGVSPF
ncbi:MAG: caspase family protein [Hyphomicrobiaceae bacterium]|nr:caspase family protein [Hyphomicrobiaceae bacterium]